MSKDDVKKDTSQRNVGEGIRERVRSEIWEVTSGFEELLKSPTQEVSRFIKGYRFRRSFPWASESLATYKMAEALSRALELYCRESSELVILSDSKPARLALRKKAEFGLSFSVAILMRSRGEMLIERFAYRRTSRSHSVEFALRTALAIYAENAKREPSPDPW